MTSKEEPSFPFQFGSKVSGLDSTSGVLLGPKKNKFLSATYSKALIIFGYSSALVNL